MFSKTLELVGLTLISVAIACWSRWEAGVLFGGLALLLIGSATDDAAVGATLRRSAAWVSYAWHRQLLRESGVPVPNLKAPRLPDEWVPCECGGNPDCPLCAGMGYVPDPQYRENPRSPHPAIKVDPEAQAFAETLAKVHR